MNSRRYFKCGSVILAALCLIDLFIAPELYSQVINDGTTNILNHVTNIVIGGITVGTNAPFTLLILTNGTLVTNSGSGVIGVSSSANSNSVRLTSGNTRWFMGQDLSIGSNGSANHLVISNSALVENNFGALGIVASSTNNDALITGAGSLWSNRNDLYIGYGGHGNRLLVTNAGIVEANSGLLGIDSSSSNNVGIVTGGASLWTNRASLFVGFSGSGNQLIASNGATVSTSNNFNLGFSVGSASNSLFLSSGATLTNRNSASIGVGTGANANLALLSDNSTRWLIHNGLTIGSNGVFNRVVISNGAQIVSGGGNLGFSTGSSNNLIVITGPGSRWSVSSADITVGASGSANSMVVSNGGAMFNSDAGAGAAQSSSNNLIWITDAGSSWTNSRNLFFGESGPGNTLVASNSAVVSVGLALTVGISLSSSNNLLILDGGTLLATNVVLGSLSPANRIVITNGGAFFGDKTVVGSGVSSTNNNILVDGGSLIATNNAGAGSLEVRRGTNLFNSGLIETDQLVLTNSSGRFEFKGGKLITLGALISNNIPFVVGFSGLTTATWDVRSGSKGHHIAGDLQIGAASSLNQLLITNGASLTNTGNGILGVNSGANSNSVILSGSGSRWVIGTDFHFGQGGSSNHLIVSNGALLQNEIGVVGQGTNSSNNEVVVSDPGSSWNNLILFLGAQGSGNRLVVTNQGAVFANIATIGSTATSIGNRLVVDGGALIVTNSLGSGYLNVLRGTNVLNAGFIEVDRLLVTNMPSMFELNGGTLITKSTTNNIGREFNVGNGLSTTTLNLASNGIHNFFAVGLTIRSNASLVGNGTIHGPVRVENGGTLAPGASIGKLMLINSIILQGNTIMEISKSGAALTNDQVQVIGPVTFGGALTVTNVGPTALAPGDQFQLFNAGGYVGSFATIALPPLGPGLTWTNKLSVDGSIQVVGTILKFSSITYSGTNLIISGAGGSVGVTYWVLTTTNLTIGVSNWTRLLTNQFDASGNFSFTNGISSVASQRFYRLQVP